MYCVNSTPIKAVETATQLNKSQLIVKGILNNDQDIMEMLFSPNGGNYSIYGIAKNILKYADDDDKKRPREAVVVMLGKKKTRMTPFSFRVSLRTLMIRENITSALDLLGWIIEKRLLLSEKKLRTMEAQHDNSFFEWAKVMIPTAIRDAADPERSRTRTLFESGLIDIDDVSASEDKNPNPEKKKLVEYKRNFIDEIEAQDLFEKAFSRAKLNSCQKFILAGLREDESIDDIARDYSVRNNTTYKTTYIQSQASKAKAQLRRAAANL